MAQAARLSLRMQKELKLLLTDPPPGVSFPLLSHPSPSLSAIQAEIEGPEGTVYAGGKFRLEIQIPERYPFQPPIVTFATQIYHPNIDNGGRICLDILNLPPKGAWQPSLNISTILTSIGLLLNEPNPDDGLMCEASKEYKYNRHAFDQKARLMTEKFARAGANGDGSCSKNSLAQLSASMVERKDSDFSKGGLEEGSASNKKGSVNRSKLSLECFKPLQNKDFGDGVNVKPIDKIERPKEVCRQMVEEHHQHDKNLSLTKRKLSLGPLGPEQKLDDEKETFKKNQNSSSLNSPNMSPIKVITHNSERLPLRDAGKTVAQNLKLLPEDFADKTEDHFSLSKRKRFGLASKRLSLGPSGSSHAQQTDNKENTDPGQSLSLQLDDNCGDLDVNSSKKIDGNACFRIQDESTGKLRGGSSEKQQDMDGLILSESVIVLDSEDSEEESQGSLRSTLLLARKRFPGKSKDYKPKVKR